MDRTENISFVVQGPISKESIPAENLFSTREVLMSIRKYFPASEIVLSTWEGSDTTDLIYDKLVLNEDPGSIVVPHIERPYNHNRLVKSSSAGIFVATKEFIVKTRTDVLFESDSLLNLLSLITPIEGSYTIFSNYLLSTNYYVRNPLRINLLFHSSDIVLAGKREDIKLYFSAPTIKRHELVTDKEQVLMVAEQYLLLKSIEMAHKKRYEFDRIDYTNTRHFMDSEKYLFSNFNFLSIADFGVKFPDRLQFAFRPEANYTLDEIKVLSKSYRKSNDLDAFSYIRATKYFKGRMSLYLKVKSMDLFNRIYNRR